MGNGAWRAVLVAILALSSARVDAQKAPTPAKRVAIRAGRLIDGKSDMPIADALILIEGDKIVRVTAGGSAPVGVDLIDLSSATVLPGFALSSIMSRAVAGRRLWDAD